MLKIIKNKGQCKARDLAKCKYLLYTEINGIGGAFARVRPKPIFWYFVAKIRGEV